jgi:hypothetical protein
MQIATAESLRGQAAAASARKKINRKEAIKLLPVAQVSKPWGEYNLKWRVFAGSYVSLAGIAPPLSFFLQSTCGHPCFLRNSSVWAVAPLRWVA